MMLPPVLFLVLVALFFVGNFREDRDTLPSTLIGLQAPSVELGQLADLPSFGDAELRQGQVSVVNFWASWCPPCRAEHPMLKYIASQGIPVWGVNARDDPANALAFLEELGNPFAAIGTTDGRAAVDWGVYGMPETFVVAGDGTVITRYAGEITEAVWRDRLLPAIEEARNR
jgi:cytochrome c biogenesis protein CcmG/thiol:disulfide interchange protein DsbE